MIVLHVNTKAENNKTKACFKNKISRFVAPKTEALSRFAPQKLLT